MSELLDTKFILSAHGKRTGKRPLFSNRSKPGAAPDFRWRTKRLGHGGLHNRHMVAVPFAASAGIYCTSVFYNFDLGWNNRKLSAGIVTHFMQCSAAFRADLLFFRQFMFYRLHRQR